MYIYIFCSILNLVPYFFSSADHAKQLLPAVK